jgi:pimeloyl-ACP methyl ester carboxylesterase
VDVDGAPLALDTDHNDHLRMTDAALSMLTGLVERFDPTAFDAPTGRARIRLVVVDDGEADVVVAGDTVEIGAPDAARTPDAILAAPREVWTELLRDVRSGLEAHENGRLTIRHNLHIGVGFLAATSGATGSERLRFERVTTPAGAWALMTAGRGEAVLLLHGLGATKGSFLPTVAALADSGRYRAIAIDLPGFGDTYKPLGEAYHPPFFAKAVVQLMDTLGLGRAHVIGNSMGGRIALELGLRHPDRVGKLVLIAPSLAWRRARPWAPIVRAFNPHLGLVQVAPRWAIEAIVHRTIPGAREGWVRAGVDEFMRAYLTPRGRVAFYAAARQIYLEEPHGAKGFWTRLAGLQPPALFIWGKHDTLVPIAFASHVQRTLASARHLQLDCGHVPQIERPRETSAAILGFLDDAAVADDTPLPAHEAAV